MSAPAPLRRVCVFCASSRRIDPRFHRSAEALGRDLARRGVTVAYGGGSVGSMGALADGALAEGGRVVGVIPRFMVELEWAHQAVELEIVEDMHTRKRRMVEDADAVVALPGGSGTFEELFEVLTAKRLGLFFRPVVIVNERGYYDPLVRLLESAIGEGFMGAAHRDMWSFVPSVAEVVPAIEGATPWGEDAREFAAP